MAHPAPAAPPLIDPVEQGIPYKIRGGGGRMFNGYPVAADDYIIAFPLEQVIDGDGGDASWLVNGLGVTSALDGPLDGYDREVIQHVAHGVGMNFTVRASDMEAIRDPIVELGEVTGGALMPSNKAQHHAASWAEACRIRASVLGGAAPSSGAARARTLGGGASSRSEVSLRPGPALLW